MKLKIILAAIAVVILAGVALLFSKTKEITLSDGPVAKVSSNASETILTLNPNNSDPVLITDTRGIATIKRTADLQRIVLSQKGMYSDKGQPVVNWDHAKSYLPAQSFRVFSRAVRLGRLEMEDGTVRDFFLPKR